MAPGAYRYDYIIEKMRALNNADDGIVMNLKIKSIQTDFCNIVQDENILSELMDYINEMALEDSETALKFALLFASHTFDALTVNKTKVQTTMLRILQKNYANAETYREHDRERLYNSIIIMSEYYHRVRLVDNSPINILGESLLKLLIQEVSDAAYVNDVKLAKLIVGQIMLNGDLMRSLHNAQISQLLYHIRRNLIEQPNVKAIMLMTLDIHYCNFTNMTSEVEKMYTKYFTIDDEDNDVENDKSKTSPQVQSQQNSNPEKDLNALLCSETELKREHTALDSCEKRDSSNEVDG